MRRSEIIAVLRELQAESANTRGWLDAVDAKIAALIESLSAPAPVEQPAPQPEPFTVDPAEGRGENPTGLAVQFDGDPVAPSLATLITPKQLGMIRALARECGVDYEVECQEQLGCKPEELGKRAASAFIDYLKALQEQGAEFKRAS